MTLGNLKQYREGVMLEEGEENRPHRVRAVSEVHEWFSSMSASERGRLLTVLYRSETATPDVTSGGDQSGENIILERVGSDVTSGVEASAPQPVAPDLTGLVQVRLTPVPNRSALSRAQLQLVETIEAGAALYRVGEAGGYVLVTPEGQRRVQHAGTVKSLRNFGIIR